MTLSPEQVEHLELLLGQLSELDPASVPEPAVELAGLLSEILEELETN